MLTKFALKNNVFTISIFVVLIVSGAMTFNSLPRDDMPPFLVRAMSIVSVYPGASPERIENLITDKLEKVVQEIPELDYVESESRTGISVVTVMIKENEFDLQPIFDRIRRKVDDIIPSFPSGCTVTIKDELGDVFGIILGLTTDGFTNAELKDVAEDMRDDLIKLPDVAKVEIKGIQKERVFVEFDEARLAEAGITMEVLKGIIGQLNIIIPGGEIETSGRRLSLEPSGSFDSVEDLRNTIVSSENGMVMRLGDLTKITRGYIKPRTEIVRINGQPGIAIAVNLKKGGNVISLGKQIDKKIIQYQEIYPIGIDISKIAAQDTVVEKSVNDFMNNLLESIVVVLLVMLVFLGFRTGTIVASLIPSAIIMTLMFLSFTGSGLNQVTLASFIIALGMLVDGAIVVSEAIMVKMEQGKKAFDAAIEASQELYMPLLISCLSTSAAFMAFFLAESVMGEIMGNIFIVVSISLLSSWLLALTMISLLCVKLLKTPEKNSSESGFFPKLQRAYRRVLLACLYNPAKLFFTIIGLFLLCVYLVQFIPVMFMPKSDRPLVTVNLELPLGSSIDETERAVEEVEGEIKRVLMVNSNKKDGVVSWSSYIGQGAPKYDLGYTAPESLPNAAHILINTSSAEANEPIISHLDNYIFEKYPDMTYNVSRLLSGGGSANPIEVRISGPDPKHLFVIANEVKAEISKIRGSRNISDNWGIRSQKIRVTIDQVRAQQAGISNQDVAIALQTNLSGVNVGVYREQDKTIPIVLINRNSDHFGITDVESLPIAGKNGNSVPLNQIANVEIIWEAPKILRKDLNKTITVTSNVQDGYTADEVVNKLDKWLVEASKNWKYGYAYEYGGDQEGSSNAMSAVSDKLPISIFVIILLLIGQFNSIRKPLIIMCAIPMGMIGVVIGLLVTGSYFGFMTFLGIISLAGMVTENAIVLLDRINLEVTENGLKERDAIIEACVQRFRPILLTTATTALGLIPLWVSGGTMWEPMAIAIIFGLTFATVLTLTFVPVLYRLFFRVKMTD